MPVQIIDVSSLGCLSLMSLEDIFFPVAYSIILYFGEMSGLGCYTALKCSSGFCPMKQKISSQLKTIMASEEPVAKLKVNSPR